MIVYRRLSATTYELSNPDGSLTSFGEGGPEHARMLAEVAANQAEILPVPPPDPMIAWAAEMLRLDAAVLNDARYWEEVAAGAVSPQAEARMNALIAQRQSHRAARP